MPHLAASHYYGKRLGRGKTLNVNERSLRERFAAAYEEFSAVYAKRVRAARAGTRPYPSQELHKDLFAAAGNHGLFAVALWSYFWRLHATTGEEEPQEEHALEREQEELRAELRQAIRDKNFWCREAQCLYAENERLRALDEAVSYVYSLYPDDTQFAYWARRTCENIRDEAQRRLEKLQG